MEEPIGRFDVTGEAEEIRLARGAIERCTFDFDRLKGDVQIKFKPAAEMPPVPGTGKPALAFCRTSRRLLLIRSGLRRPTARSVLIHEIGHIVDADRLKSARRGELMGLMRQPASSWRGGEYQQRACECFAETFVRAFSDVRSSLEGYYGRHVDDSKLKRYREIVLRTAEDEPDEEPEPDPDPEPEPDETLTLGDDDEEEGHSTRVPVKVVAGQVGTIERGTPFFHPDSGIRITNAAETAEFRLVGETLDGRFRFAVVETSRLVEGERLRALLIVEASRVSNLGIREGA